MSPEEARLEALPPGDADAAAGASDLAVWIRRAAWALVVLGIVARVVRYLANRSLWSDECSLALNVMERSYAGLFEPLAFEQVAPIGFLTLAKTTVQLLGSGEYALRLVPLLAGLGALPLFYLTLREFLARGEAAVAVALLAVSEPFVFYSSEFKQYSSEVFACVLILLPGTRILCRGMTAKRALALAGAGVLGVWLSITAVFVFCGVGGALLLQTLLGQRFRQAGIVALVCAVSAASFAAHYLPFLAAAQSNKYLVKSWKPYMAPVPAFDAATFDWYRKAATAVFNDPLGFPSTGVAAAVFLVGAVVLARRRALLLPMVLAPVGLALVASMLGKMPFPVSEEHHLLERFYPYYGRILLFAGPLFFACLGAGLAFLLRSSDGRGNFLGPIVALVLLALPVYQLVRNTLSPPEIQESRPLMAAIAERYEDGDRIYTQSYALSTITYYAKRAGLPAPAELEPRKAKEEAAVPDDGPDPFTPGTRLWYVVLQHPHWDTQSEFTEVRATLARLAERVEQLDFENAKATLYGVREQAAAPGARAESKPSDDPGQPAKRPERKRPGPRRQ